MNHELNEFDPDIPLPDDTSESDVKNTVSGVLNLILKLGTLHLVKVVLDALGL